jgi:hypothetical protein
MSFDEFCSRLRLDKSDTRTANKHRAFCQIGNALQVVTPTDVALLTKIGTPIDAESDIETVEQAISCMEKVNVFLNDTKQKYSARPSFARHVAIAFSKVEEAVYHLKDSISL